VLEPLLPSLGGGGGAGELRYAGGGGGGGGGELVTVLEVGVGVDGGLVSAMGRGGGASALRLLGVARSTEVARRLVQQQQQQQQQQQPSGDRHSHLQEEEEEEERCVVEGQPPAARVRINSAVEWGSSVRSLAAGAMNTGDGGGVGGWVDVMLGRIQTSIDVSAPVTVTVSPAALAQGLGEPGCFYGCGWRSRNGIAKNVES
jgi:hypothetical protein